MNGRKNLEERGYSKAYIDARIKIDNLCCNIQAKTISSRDAMLYYDQLEFEYLKIEPEQCELFRGIYRQRIERLIARLEKD